MRSDLKYITDILEKLIRVYSKGYHVRDIIDEWKQLKEMYKMRHGVVGDVIDIGEQLLARYEEWCHVSLYKLDQWVRECKASCGIKDIWEQLMQWRSQPKRSGWVQKVGLPEPLRGRGLGRGFAPLPNLENFEKMKPISPSFYAI